MIRADCLLMARYGTDDLVRSPGNPLRPELGHSQRTYLSGKIEVRVFQEEMMSRVKNISVLAATLLAISATPSVFADESMVKKTMDGRCLASDHKDYWETKVYVAKPSMAECLKSGGKPAK